MMPNVIELINTNENGRLNDCADFSEYRCKNSEVFRIFAGLCTQSAKSAQSSNLRLILQAYFSNSDLCLSQQAIFFTYDVHILAKIGTKPGHCSWHIVIAE